MINDLSQNFNTKNLEGKRTLMKKNKLSRASMVVAAVAASAVGLISTNAGTALAAPPIGTVAMSPTSGNSDTVFSMTPSEFPAASGGAFCSGPGTASYRWQTYIVDSGVDPSTLTFGSGPNPVAGHYVSRMFDAGGNPVSNKNPTSTGQITGIPTFSLAVLTLAPGDYKLGFACTLSGAVENGRYWQTTMTVAANSTAGGTGNFIFGQPAAAFAPTLVSATGGDGVITGSFSDAGLSIPGVTSYTVTAHPTAGADLTLPLTTAGAFSIPGATNGVTYSVTVTATNSVGTSPASSAINATPQATPHNLIQGFAATQGANLVHLSWTLAPEASGPTGYSLAVSPALAGAPTTLGAGVTSVDIANPVDGVDYTFTLTATYSAAPTGVPAIVHFTYAGAMIIQDITVSRPQGRLILTQVCGVNGALAAEAATANGFPATDAVSADNIGPAGPTLGAFGAGGVDPEYTAGNYPFPTLTTPPTPPTHCTVDLGTAAFITGTSPLAGQFYAATGKLNQVTVADNRDGSAAWTVNGKITTPFSNGPTNTFSGNYLGWTPKVTSATPGQTVTAGPAIQPSATDTYVPGTPTTGEGLAGPQLLASAPSGAAQGIATLDARLKLLIPVSKASGTYTAALTISAI